MTITTITRFHYEDNDLEYRWRLDYFKNEVVPRLQGQDTDINVWCNDWQRSELESIESVQTFDVDVETRRNHLGYLVDFADWKQVSGLKKYDVQIGLDSDDLVAPTFIEKVKDVLSDKDKSVHISFQPVKLDTETGETHEMKRTYDDQGSPVFAIYQPNKQDYNFAYCQSHLDLPERFENSVYIRRGYVKMSVHDFNDSTSL